MSPRNLNRLCAVYRAFRVNGFTAPLAWRYSLKYLADQPTETPHVR